MESSNFEKEVSQKLEEFKIPPEEEVWSRIEKEIAPKGGTRKGVLLFLLLLLISAGGAWWLTHENSASKFPSTFENVVKRENRDEAKGMTSLKVEKNKKTTDANVSQSPKHEANASSSKVETAATNSIKRIPKKSNQFISAKPARSFASKPTDQFSTKQVENIALTDESRNEDLNEIPIPGKIINVPLTGDLTTSKPLQFQTLNPYQPFALNLKKQSIKKGEWTIGFTLSGGSSWIEGKEAHGLYANNVQTGSFNTAYVYYPLRSSYAYHPSRPTSFHASFSFTAGVFAERNLTSKTNVSLGLSYSHLSLQNNVSNNFEFVQLPVLFHFRVNRNDHLPLTFDAGVTASQLMAANAQQYNYFSDRWYHDNDLFNKFQANIYTGFSFTVFNKEGKQILVGPGFSYGFTQLSNSGIYESKHLQVLNLHAEILFGKK